MKILGIPVDKSWEFRLKVNFDAYVREQIKNGEDPAAILKRINDGSEIRKWWNHIGGNRNAPVLRKQGGIIKKYNLGNAIVPEDRTDGSGSGGSGGSGGGNGTSDGNNEVKMELTLPQIVDETINIPDGGMKGNRGYIYNNLLPAKTADKKVSWADPTITALELSKFLGANFFNSRILNKSK